MPLDPPARHSQRMATWTFVAISAAGSVLSGLAAAVAVSYAAAQDRTANRDRREQQAREVDGVSVSWLPLEVPDRPDDDGMAQWLYEFRIDNPARFPIDRVRATVHFPVPVRRIRYSGRVEGHSTTLSSTPLSSLPTVTGCGSDACSSLSRRTARFERRARR